MSGVKVTFTTPASGASGTFAGGNNTAVTSSAGTATSAAFTANATAGSYTVTASAPGVSGTASFSLMNQPGSVGTTTTINSTSSDSHGFPLPKNDALVLGPPVTVNFTVAQTSGSVAPTGTVAVKDGFGDTCTTTTLNNGVGLCSLTISQFGTGSTPITAAYTPFTGGGFTASTSSSMTENLVEVVAPCANASDVDIKTTSMMWQDTITVCLAGNEKAVPAVAIVTDCMLGFVCNPPPPTVTAVPGEANTYTVTVTGTKTSTVNGSLRDPQPRGGPWRLELFGLCGLLAMLIALQLARHHRTRLRLSCAAAVLFVLLLTGMSACTSGNSGTGNSGTPPGTYTIDVTITVGGFKVVVPVVVVVTK